MRQASHRLFDLLQATEPAAIEQLEIRIGGEELKAVTGSDRNPDDLAAEPDQQRWPGIGGHQSALPDGGGLCIGGWLVLA
jgi:hypothetical protein